MPSYNCGKYLDHSVLSVFSQVTRHKIVLLISNDCSTDNTEDVLNRLQTTFIKDDFEIKVFNQTLILELLIEEKEITTPDEIKFIDNLITYLSTTECKNLNWNNQVLDYINRINFLSNLNEKIPTLDIDYLKKNPKEWLQDYLHNLNRI